MYIITLVLLFVCKSNFQNAQAIEETFRNGSVSNSSDIIFIYNFDNLRNLNDLIQNVTFITGSLRTITIQSNWRFSPIQNDPNQVLITDFSSINEKTDSGFNCKIPFNYNNYLNYFCIDNDISSNLKKCISDESSLTFSNCTVGKFLLAKDDLRSNFTEFKFQFKRSFNFSSEFFYELELKYLINAIPCNGFMDTIQFEINLWNEQKFILFESTKNNISSFTNRWNSLRACFRTNIFDLGLQVEVKNKCEGDFKSFIAIDQIQISQINSDSNYDDCKYFIKQNEITTIASSLIEETTINENLSSDEATSEMSNILTDTYTTNDLLNFSSNQVNLNESTLLDTLSSEPTTEINDLELTSHKTTEILDTTKEFYSVQNTQDTTYDINYSQDFKSSSSTFNFHTTEELSINTLSFSADESTLTNIQSTQDSTEINTYELTSKITTEFYSVQNTQDTTLNIYSSEHLKSSTSTFNFQTTEELNSDVILTTATFQSFNSTSNIEIITENNQFTNDVTTKKSSTDSIIDDTTKLTTKDDTKESTEVTGIQTKLTSQSATSQSQTTSSTTTKYNSNYVLIILSVIFSLLLTITVLFSIFNHFYRKRKISQEKIQMKNL
ncbi:unnamed protein product [Brachionus calyciflorus]|uniref:Uncharacterized protein n=1 Tax=Brachionus calyciflorus TaxID=104777 RepID=A0A813M3V3_9BILA|nr:unnamed protein product [Brachionus calyciflorus]